MSVSSSQIAEAVVEAAIAELKKYGLEREFTKLPGLLSRVAEEKVGVVRAMLTTPSGNAGPLRQKIVDVLQKKLGSPVELEEKADSSLIGGAVLQFGDERIDLSLKSALHDMEATLKAGASVS